MKKQLLYTTIILASMLTTISSRATTKSIQDHFNQDAQKNVYKYCLQSVTDFSKATLVCKFLNNSAHFATFPANTTITIRNRQYVKTQNTFYGNWCIVLPKDNTPSQDARNLIQSKPKFIFIPRKESVPKLSEKLVYIKSSKRRRDE